MTWYRWCTQVNQLFSDGIVFDVAKWEEGKIERRFGVIADTRRKNDGSQGSDFIFTTAILSNNLLTSCVPLSKLEANLSKARRVILVSGWYRTFMFSTRLRRLKGGLESLQTQAKEWWFPSTLYGVILGQWLHEVLCIVCTTFTYVDAKHLHRLGEIWCIFGSVLLYKIIPFKYFSDLKVW